MSEAPALHVIARSPFQVYFEGDAQVLSATNKVGPFDILPGHADFFSMLKAGEVVVTTGDDAVSFQIQNGIITVRDDEIMLFADI